MKVKEKDEVLMQRHTFIKIDFLFLPTLFLLIPLSNGKIFSQENSTWEMMPAADPSVAECLNVSPVKNGYYSGVITEFAGKKQISQSRVELFVKDRARRIHIRTEAGYTKIRILADGTNSYTVFDQQRNQIIRQHEERIPDSFLPHHIPTRILLYLSLLKDDVKDISYKREFADRDDVLRFRLYPFIKPKLPEDESSDAPIESFDDDRSRWEAVCKKNPANEWQIQFIDEFNKRGTQTGSTRFIFKNGKGKINLPGIETRELASRQLIRLTILSHRDFDFKDPDLWRPDLISR